MPQQTKEMTALGKLITRPIVPEPVKEESVYQKLLALEQHIRVSEAAPIHPCCNDFRQFLRLCWTKDEAAGGKVALMPDWPFLDDLAEDLILVPKLFVEKSRRVLASWLVCCFDVWVAAGGQDPRWPTLMNARGNRQVFVAARQFEQANWFLFERIKFLIEESVRRGLRQYWPDFPRWSWKEGLGVASNGSRISAVAQGADQLRGHGATFHHWEEVSFWERAKETVEGSVPTIRGGGHICMITTANANSYAEMLVTGRIRRTAYE